jgi:hypothetical protein
MITRLIVPEVFAFFGQEWLHVSPRQVRQWWKGLSASTSPQAVVMRTALLCQAALPYLREQFYWNYMFYMDSVQLTQAVQGQRPG